MIKIQPATNRSASQLNRFASLAYDNDCGASNGGKFDEIFFSIIKNFIYLQNRFFFLVNFDPVDFIVESF